MRRLDRPNANPLTRDNADQAGNRKVGPGNLAWSLGNGNIEGGLDESSEFTYIMDLVGQSSEYEIAE